MRVAVVSSDGKVINQHFGKAHRFLVFDIEDKIKFIEERKNMPVCGTAEDGHTDESINNTIFLIKDCNIMLCAKIGGRAEEILKKYGIQSIETPYFICDALKEMKQTQQSNK
jgi:nitrogen fixation protein NifX